MKTITPKTIITLTLCMSIAGLFQTVSSGGQGKVPPARVDPARVHYDEDRCTGSDSVQTIIIDGCESGVNNQLFDDGCSMADLVAEVGRTATNHGALVSKTAELLNEWKKDGLITGKEKGAIQSCVAKLHRRPEREALWGGVNNGDIFDESGPVIDEMLDQMAAANLRVLRVLIDYRLEMDEDGDPLPDGHYNDCILNWIDRLMVKARQRGILLLITLQAHNWIMNSNIEISKEFYEWRNCKTPYNVYLKSLSDGPQVVIGPYAARRWSADYLTNKDARKAYKDRVYHILNHYNYFLEKKWKDINDVVWAWALQS